MWRGFLAFVYVGVGGLVGSICRYGLTLLTQGSAITFPAGTLTSNLAGCFVIGIVAQIAADTELLSPATRLFLATGFCGGFTTLSSLIYELMQMIKSGEWLYAVIYVNATFFGAVLAFLLGSMAVRLLLRA